MTNLLTCEHPPAHVLTDILSNGKKINYFDFEDKQFVAKVLPKAQAIHELKNAHLFQSKVNAQTWIVAAIPQLTDVSADKSILVMRDYGKNLAEKIIQGTISCFDLETLLRLILLVLSYKICWDGLVPRNLFCRENDTSQLVAIDFEEIELIPIKRVSSLVILKWSLGWAGFVSQIKSTEVLYQKIGAFLSHEGFSIDNQLVPALDDFEAVHYRLSNTKSAQLTRAYCNKLTLMTEGILATTQPSLAQLPFKIGHLAEDILLPYSADLSFLYSLCAADIRSLGEKEYQNFLKTLDNKLSQNQSPQAYARDIWFEIDAELFNFINPRLNDLYSNLKALSNKFGLNAAIQRAALVEQLIYRLSKFLMLLPVEMPQLLVRGSLAHGILTTKSDVDFEFSSTTFPNGHLDLENILIAFCKIFDIACEGSLDRPKEKDLLSHQAAYGTRDLHEWMEMRVLMEDSKNALWSYPLFDLPKNFWACKSQYEREYYSLTAKHLFFQVRCLIQRLGYQRDCFKSNLPHILSSLPKQLADNLLNLLQESIMAYDNSQSYSLTELDDLQTQINYIAQKNNLPVILNTEQENAKK